MESMEIALHEPVSTGRQMPKLASGEAELFSSRANVGHRLRWHRALSLGNDFCAELAGTPKP